MEVGRIKKATFDRVQSKGKTAADSIQFQSVMEKKRNETTYDRLAKRMAEIEVQGERLSKTQTIDNLRKYKKMVKDFLQDAVSNGLELSQQYSFNQRGSGVHRLVKEVDGKLLDLTNEMLEKEKNSLKITTLVGEIKGMLINIYT